jgi:hypothetical protein
MINPPFANDTDQQTRRQVLKDAYFSRAQSDADMIGGRFKKENATQVVGIPTYPTPPNGPWATPDPSGPEPPLGYDINALPELGEVAAPATLPCAVETASPSRGGLSSNSPPDNPPPLSRMRRRV